MEVRRATKKDIPQLTDLFYEFYLKFNMNKILSGVSKELLQVDNAREFSRDEISSYFEGDDIVYVYEIDGKLIGYISGVIKKHKHLLKQVEGHIYDWFVTEEYRGKGVGKKLYNKFVEYIKSKGCSFITLEAFWTNAETIKTYERMGFTKEEVVLKKIV